ncbi:MAG: DNA adenine methylase [Paludibacter sp.]|nr:DNA adenine methylase [Paludibacter sp.]
MEQIKTEGIKYAGSKLKLIPHILEMSSELSGVNSVLDGFSGSTRVSQAFAQKGCQVMANDISAWSEVFGNCYLKTSSSKSVLKEIIEHLNHLNPVDGWFTAVYGGDEQDTKKPFQRKNTQKLDAIRDEIDRLDLNIEDKSVLLTSLILALDKVDNTLGHYAAYLSKWSARSYKNLELKLPYRIELLPECQVIRDDIFNTVGKYSFDLAYFDPPYGSNNEKMPPSRVRYASYYHIWTTIIQNDKPEIFGKANRRTDTRDNFTGSVFEEFRKNKNGEFKAMDALRQLVKKTKARYLMLSYSSGGRATKEQLIDIIQENGVLLKVKKIDFKKNVMSYLRSTNEWAANDDRHLEYIFLMEKK